MADGIDLQRLPSHGRAQLSQYVPSSGLVARARNDLSRLLLLCSRAELEAVSVGEWSHDHFCCVCSAYIGCPRPYCGLPTESRCIDHGWWPPFANSGTHVHECRECDGHDEECVSVVDWVHEDGHCREPRLWPCPGHRPAAEDVNES